MSHRGKETTITTKTNTLDVLSLASKWDDKETGRRRFHINNYRDENALAIAVIAYIRDLLAQH